MNCAQAEKLMSLIVDNESHVQIAEDFQSHLNSCESCRSTFQSIKALDSDLRILGDILKSSGAGSRSSALLPMRTDKSSGGFQDIFWIRAPVFALIITIAVFLGARMGVIFSETIWPGNQSKEEMSMFIPDQEMSVSYVMANLSEGNLER